MKGRVVLAVIFAGPTLGSINKTFFVTLGGFWLLRR